MPKNILFYVSSHGFGHSTRQMEVIRQIFQRNPEGTRVIVKTKAPKSLFSVGSISAEYFDCETDVGLVQEDSMTCDLPATLERLEALWGNADKWIENEVRFAKENDVGVIVSDICPLAFDVSKSLGVTGIGISNFSWDWIYESYTAKEKAFLPYIEKIKKSYAKCDVMCRLPFHGELSAFSRIWDIPCIARKSPFSKSQIKKQLGLETNEKLVLFSFGGFGMRSLPLGKLFCMNDYSFVTTGDEDFKDGNVTCFSDETLRKRGIMFQDIVRGAEAVITKLGYGIVTECLANETPILAGYRDDFPESHVFLERLGKLIPFVPIEKEALLSGRWEDGLSELYEKERVFKKIPVHGAEVAAQIILKALSGNLNINEESRLFNAVL